MNRIVTLGSALTAAALLFFGPAQAQVYGYGWSYGPRAYYDPTYGWPGYSGDAPFDADGPLYDGYDPYAETFVDPGGYGHRRCRAHEACSVDDGP